MLGNSSGTTEVEGHDDAVEHRYNGHGVLPSSPIKGIIAQPRQSDTRIATTLIHAMVDRDATLGLATMCIGVGQGIAVIFERA
jgi:hypothetical protein